MMRRLSGVLGLVISFAAIGCGSDSGGGSGNSAATLAACNAYCDAYIAKACTNPFYSSVAECQSLDCGVISNVPSQCQASLKAYYDCRKNQADLCGDTGCNAELTTSGMCR